jgi:hypothetical protein
MLSVSDSKTRFLSSCDLANAFVFIFRRATSRASS